MASVFQFVERDKLEWMEYVNRKLLMGVILHAEKGRSALIINV
jgi:hypothetical protein